MRRFNAITLENWRNFKHVEVTLQERTILVGPNGSGKSNFLDTFRFLSDLAVVGGGFQNAVAKRSGVSVLRCMAARASSDIAIEVELIDDSDPDWQWTYILSFNQDKFRKPKIKREVVRKNGVLLLERPDTDDNKDSERLTQTYLEQVYANYEFREVAEFFASIHYLHVIPQLIRESDRSIGRTNDPFGADFLEQIMRTQANTQRARLRRIRDALKIVVPQLEELELERDPHSGTPHLRGRFAHGRDKGAWLNEGQLSDGTLRLLGLLWAALDGTGPLLLEEPELSLHSGIVSYIPQLFAKLQTDASRARQFLFSTHSAELLRSPGLGRDEVLLLKPLSHGREGTSVTPLGEIEEARDLLDAGLDVAEVAIPQTTPSDANELSIALDI